MKTNAFKVGQAFSPRWLLAGFLIVLGTNAYAPSGPTSLSATLMTSLSFTNLTAGQSYQMQRVFKWYWTNLDLAFTATNSSYSNMVAGAWHSGDYRLAQTPVPNQAFAAAQVLGDSVVSATILDGGSGYTVPPIVSLVRGGGTNASAIAEVSSDGVVTNLVITSGGGGYTSAPIVQIAPPPAIAVSAFAKPVMRFSLPINFTGSRVQYATSISNANWQLVPGSFATNQVDFFVTNDVYFFRTAVFP